MSNRKISGEPEDADNQKVPSALWNVAVWALALGAFAVATVSSYREIHYNIPNDLRSPAILLVNALLATVVAFGFALHEGSLKRWSDVHLCLRFGFWSAAVFRLLPPILNEGDGLYLRNCGTFDVPYVVLGACIHAGLAALLTCPYAIRVLDPKGHRWLANDESLLEMCGSVILIFFIVAGIVRLLAENWWLGFL
jgi:hypothetical protein